MGVAVARNINYGAAYTNYAAKKDLAVFIGAENMVGDFDLVFDNNQLDDIWLEFREAGADYHSKGKKVTRDLFVIEYSPTPDESRNWTKEDWFNKAKELLQEIDNVVLMVPMRDKKGKWILDDDGKKKLFPVPKTQLRNSKWMCMLHRDSASGIYHLHILISRFTVDNKLNNNFDIAKRAARAAETINERYGITTAMDIRQQHINEINAVINDILADMQGDSVNLKEFKARVEAATFIDYKGRPQHYTVKFRADGKGNVGYSVGRGKSTFTATELGQKFAHIPVDREAFLKDVIYNVLRDMDGQRFDWDKFLQMMEDNNCQVNLRRDSKGNIVNYSVVYDGETYTASQIGSKLTAKKIIGEWERIHESERETKAAETARTIPFIPFADVKPDIFMDDDNRMCISVSIDGKDYKPKTLSKEHAGWYLQSDNQEATAFQLAMHYYANEIQKTQIHNYNEQHFKNGKMPYGITVNESYGHSAETGGGKYWLRGVFTQNGKTIKHGGEVRRDDYIKWVNSQGDDAKAVVCDTVGRDLIKNIQIPTIADYLRNKFGFPADFGTLDAVDQTIETFKDFTDELCGSFVDACGAAAVAFLNAAMGGEGQSVGGGGGGGQQSGWGKKKDDDDFFRPKNSIFNFKTPKRGKGLRR